jgi:hypothetical protein
MPAGFQPSPASGKETGGLGSPTKQQASPAACRSLQARRKRPQKRERAKTGSPPLAQEHGRREARQAAGEREALDAGGVAHEP